MNIGLIGLGMMGRGVAGNLLKTGHEIVVYDISDAAMQPLIDQGAKRAQTPQALARDCELVFTSLPKPSDVMAVCNQPDGLRDGFQPGTVWFDLSTNSVEVVRSLHASLRSCGVEFLDAPISGGPTGAASGKLAIWIGGDKVSFDRHKPVLDAFADQVRYVGEIGAGSITKLAHNLASTAIKAVLGEVLTMGVKAGLEPLALWEAMRSGAAGRARGFDNIQRFLSNSTDVPSFALSLMQKDINLALELGRQFDVPMRVCNAVGQDIHEAIARGWGQRDSQSIMDLQRLRAGVDPFAISKDDLDRVLSS